MATTTTNYSLRKPATTDAVNVTTDISDSMDTIDTTLFGMVPKSLFDANTVLYATTDDTPVALSVGASTVVGRRAAGNIVAIDFADLLTDIGAAGTESPTFTGTVNCAALTASGAVLVPDGSATAPSLAFGSDADGTGTGIYRFSANTFGFASNGAVCMSLNATGIGVIDAFNLAVGTSTGTKIGTSITQKLGFYNTTPIAQRASADQAAVATTGATAVTPFGYTTAAQANAIVTLVNELRAWAVAQGFIKGSA